MYFKILKVLRIQDISNYDNFLGSQLLFPFNLVQNLAMSHDQIPPEQLKQSTVVEGKGAASISLTQFLVANSRYLEFITHNSRYLEFYFNIS